jgi:hypothetical protein
MLLKPQQQATARMEHIDRRRRAGLHVATITRNGRRRRGRLHGEN